MLVYIYLSIVAYAKKFSLRFPIVKEENERHLLCEERQTIKKIKKNQHFNKIFSFLEYYFRMEGMEWRNEKNNFRIFFLSLV